MFESITHWCTSVWYSSLRKPSIHKPVLEMKYKLDVWRELGVSVDRGEPMLRQTLMSVLDEEGQTRFLTFLEVTVMYLRDYGDEDVDFGELLMPKSKVLGYLDEILSHGSKWEVITDRGMDSGLRARVNETVVALAKASGSDPLIKAWNAAFGRTPNPSEAIRELKGAIELAYQPIVMPAQTNGSIIGHVIGELKNNNKFRTSFDATLDVVYGNSGSAKLKKPDVIAWLADTMNILQLLEFDRHKIPQTEGKQPADYQNSVEAAVILGTVLVDLAKRGFLAKK